MKFMYSNISREMMGMVTKTSIFTHALNTMNIPSQALNILARIIYSVYIFPQLANETTMNILSRYIHPTYSIWDKVVGPNYQRHWALLKGKSNGGTRATKGNSIGSLGNPLGTFPNPFTLQTLIFHPPVQISSVGSFFRPSCLAR